MANATWQNRIIGYRMIPIEELTANPRNYRIHPKHQQDALSGVIDEAGYIVPVVNNVRTGFLLDGHLRVTLAMRRGETHVPGVDVDVEPEDEAKVLATLDPISALATADPEALAALLEDVKTQNESLLAMLTDVARDAGVGLDFAPVGIDEQGRLDEKAMTTCPECGHVF
jgi:ParB-like chromosome segregation protein Spo0J